jgi:hypothetical protein
MISVDHIITVGIDDTDTLDHPGTNQLARHLVDQLRKTWRATLITRHQLLEDPRVPCTRRNGCVAINFEANAAGLLGELEAAIRTVMVDWCPDGSDPGLCLCGGDVPAAVIDFGQRCQRELVTQADARNLAAEQGLQLMGLGGTEDGVIGALAAVGLNATRDDGRVIFLGTSEIDHFDISGVYPVSRLQAFGVDEVRRLDGDDLVTTGTVALGKRLRPNYRQGKVVLFVTPAMNCGTDWFAERVL